ncbi:Major fimbrial subunit SMF-1 [Pseudomonas fluorescens]|uniref:fimbrial protein n=1 Tax=Pseudomonas fluorescens TaxID=294 RepID=UPI001255D2A7|nr:fimbrial protein [Pseudomonas fluorescens]VVP32041.1 Major fimbrial subunit SMF-1 [Pseudomonas fluorescens]
MRMNHRVSCGVFLSFIWVSVQAYDGTIDFSGELFAQTCTVSVDGQVTPAVATVTLPGVSTSALDTTGRVTGRTSFNIQLTGCSGPALSAISFFEAGPGVDTQTGHVRNLSGTAANVNMQLLDAANDRTIRAGRSRQLTETTLNTINSGSANMAYAVQYIASGVATPGTVNGSVTYSIDYR